jgi:hypothetical protein
METKLGRESYNTSDLISEIDWLEYLKVFWTNDWEEIKIQTKARHYFNTMAKHEILRFKTFKSQGRPIRIFITET